MASAVNEVRVVLLAVGAFNPPTNMHLRMFELARDHLHRIGGYRVVGGIMSPVHDAYGKKELVPAIHRCRMVEEAAKTSDWIHFSTWETQQSGWSRTIVSLQHHQETLNSLNSNGDSPLWVREIQKQSSGQAISVKLLCGADLLESFAVPNLWRDEDIENIVTNHGLVVITRAGSNPEHFIYESDLLTRIQKNITIVPEWITNEISSTRIRRALRRGESVKYLVQDSVLDYIKSNCLYSS